MVKIAKMAVAALAACASMAALADGLGATAGFPAPSQAAVAQAQGRFARTQLMALAAFLSVDSSGASAREALRNGWSPVDRNYASATDGWPARGPSMGESIEPLLAMAKAAALGCDQAEGACQRQAASWAKSAAGSVLRAKQPGAELSRRIDELG